MSWLQLIAHAQDHHIDDLEQAMLNAGAVSVSLQEHITKGAEEQPILEPPLGETPLWHRTRLTALFDANCDTQKIQWLISESMSPAPQLRWEQLEDKDWEREWMQNYQPIQCADKLWVCPSWLKPPDPTAVNLLLDPGLAFGTGTHPTTFLCMQWLAKQRLAGKQVIDYGCGSGILGITALLLGAKFATGIDIDPQALTATHNNVIRNHLEPKRFALYLPQHTDTLTPADVVIANILSDPLLALSSTLIELINPGGLICLSGILEKQAQTIIHTYQHEIDFEPSSQKGEWVRLCGIRKTP